MKLSPPKLITWWIAVVLGVLGILINAGLLTVAALSGFSFWMVAIAFVLLAVATITKGL